MFSEDPKFIDNIQLSNIKDIIDNKSEVLCISDALSKICVSPPYFYFKNIYKYQEYLISPISPEQPISKEIGQISIGECGRSLAILGSCACSLYEKKRFYYLVENAFLNNLSTFINNDISNIGKKLYLVMRSYVNEKNKCGAKGFIISEEGNILHSCVMSYFKLSSAMFNRFFQNNLEVNVYDGKNSPYAKLLNFNISDEVNNGFNLSISIDKKDCVGHFENCPAIPTAFLIYNIIQFCGNKISQESRKSNFCIHQVNLKLKELLFPSTDCKIAIQYQRNGNIIYYDVVIIQNDIKNGEINFIMSII